MISSIPMVIGNQFNYSKCPGPLEIQTADIQNTFSLNEYIGIYYEILYHDYTQKICPSATCITSNKTFNSSFNCIEDNFVLNCEGNADPSLFTYNITSLPGYFVGNAYDRVFNGTFFPDTVVGKGDIIISNITNNKQYDWVIEFQCRDKKDEFGISIIEFIGINFYVSHNNPTQQLINDMMNIAYQQGLGIYLNQSETMVPQNNCTYPWSK